MLADFSAVLDRVDAFLAEHQTRTNGLRPDAMTLLCMLSAIEHPMQLDGGRPTDADAAWAGRLALARQLIAHVRDRWHWRTGAALDPRIVQLLIALASRDAIVNLVYAAQPETGRYAGVHRPAANLRIARQLIALVGGPSGVEYREAIALATEGSVSSCAPEPGSWAEVFELERQARARNACVDFAQAEALRRRLRIMRI